MKKLYIFTGLVLLVINTNVFAQRWVVRYNGTGNAIDAIKGMVVDNSGNVYITGYITGVVGLDPVTVLR